MTPEQVEAAFDRVNLSIDARHDFDGTFSHIAFLNDGRDSITVTVVNDSHVSITLARWVNPMWRRAGRVRLDGVCAEPSTIATAIDLLASTDWGDQ